LYRIYSQLGVAVSSVLETYHSSTWVGTARWWLPSVAETCSCLLTFKHICYVDGLYFGFIVILEQQRWITLQRKSR